MEDSTQSVEQLQKRLRFVRALNNMDAAWMDFLQEKGVFDMHYSDLYTGMWTAREPVRKQKAIQFMQNLGPQTAKKYLDKVIDQKLIIEIPDPQDGRAKLIKLDPDFNHRLESFFDHAIELFRRALI